MIKILTIAILSVLLCTSCTKKPEIATPPPFNCEAAKDSTLFGDWMVTKIDTTNYTAFDEQLRIRFGKDSSVTVFANGKQAAHYYFALRPHNFYPNEYPPDIFFYILPDSLIISPDSTYNINPKYLIIRGLAGSLSVNKTGCETTINPAYLYDSFVVWYLRKIDSLHTN